MAVDDLLTNVLSHIRLYIEIDASSDGIKEETSFQSILCILTETSGSLEFAITDLIEMLEKYLTSSVDQERHRASLLLAELLDRSASQLFLPATAVHLLMVFFCHRLSDYPSILPSLKALIALVNQYSSNDDLNLPNYRYDLADIVQTVFKNIHCPSFAQNIRQLVYNLIDRIITISATGPKDDMPLKDIQADVLNGVVCAMEGEKDPRCLLSALKILFKAEVNFSDYLDENSEICEMIFDSSACYFPITFSPPPDDPFGISPGDLIKALEDCLCAGNATMVTSHTVNFALNQIESDSMIGREHALNVLFRVVQLHGHTALKLNGFSLLPTLGNLLYTVVTTEASTCELVPKALLLISEISTSISQDFNGAYARDWEAFIHMLMKKVCKELQDSLDSIQAKAAVIIGFSIGRSSSSCYSVVVRTLMPVLMRSIATVDSCLRAAVSKSAMCFVRKIEVLPSISEKDRLTSSALEMLMQLIQIAYDRPAGVSHAVPSSIDDTHLLLDPFPASSRREVFELLRKFLSPVVLGVESQDDNGVCAMGTSYTDDELEGFSLKPDVISVLGESVHAMNALLSRFEPADFEGIVVSDYINTVTNVMLYDAQCLWKTSPCESKERSEASPLRSACLALLRSLSRQPLYLDIVKEHCIQMILGKEGSHSQSHQLLSVIIKGSPGASLVSMFAPVLQQQLVNTIACIQSNYHADDTPMPSDASLTGTHLKTVAQCLSAFNSLMHQEPVVSGVEQNSRYFYLQNLFETPYSTDDTVVDNEMKVLYLTGLDPKTGADAGASIAFTIINNIVRGSSYLVRSSNKISGSAREANCIFGTILSLVRRVVYALQTPQQTTFCEKVIEMIMPYNHPNQLQNRLSAVLFQALLCNLLVFLDKASPIFLNSGNPTDGSIDIYDAPSNKSYRVAVVEIVLSLALNSLGEVESIAGIFSNADFQHYWLESAAEGDAESNSLKDWQFGPAQLICLLANKLPADELLNRMCTLLLRVLESRVNTLVVTSAGAKRDGGSGDSVAEMTLWTLKGISARAGASGGVVDEYRQKFLSLLVDTLTSTNPKITNEDHFDFRNVLANISSDLFLDHPFILAPSSRCNLLFFWKQRLWSSLFPSLFSRIQTSKEGKSDGSPADAITSSICLLAITRLITGLPLQIIKSSFRDLVDVTNFTVSSIASNSLGAAIIADMRSQCVLTLEILLSYDATTFATHISAVVLFLLDVVRSSSVGRERAAAIKGLLAIGNQVPYPRIFPLKKAVLKALRGGLDDKKAAVRQLAAKAKNYWMLLK